MEGNANDKYRRYYEIVKPSIELLNIEKGALLHHYEDDKYAVIGDRRMFDEYGVIIPVEIIKKLNDKEFIKPLNMKPVHIKFIHNLTRDYFIPEGRINFKPMNQIHFTKSTKSANRKSNSSTKSNNRYRSSSGKRKTAKSYRH